MDVSANIKAIRQMRGIAQAEIARRLDIEPPSYHRLEKRGSKLSIEQLESIAQALGVGVLELLTWGDEKPQVPSQLEANELKQDLAKLDEIVTHQREKIRYMQMSCAELIVGMAADEFNLDAKLIPIENHETYELEDAIPDDWSPFLANFLVSNSIAFELIEGGVIDERTIMRFGTGNGTNVPVPKEIRRKLQKRIEARRRSVDGSF